VRALLAELNRVYTYEELKAKPPPKVLACTMLISDQNDLAARSDTTTTTPM